MSMSALKFSLSAIIFSLFIIRPTVASEPPQSREDLQRLYDEIFGASPTRTDDKSVVTEGGVESSNSQNQKRRHRNKELQYLQEFKEWYGDIGDRRNNRTRNEPLRRRSCRHSSQDSSGHESENEILNYTQKESMQRLKDIFRRVQTLDQELEGTRRESRIKQIENERKELLNDAIELQVKIRQLGEGHLKKND